MPLAQGSYYVPDGSEADTQPAVFSPDGSRFVVLTRRGDLARNLILESLLYWEAAPVKEALARSLNFPAPRVIFRTAFVEDAAAITKLAWLDNERLAFIAKGPGGFNQGLVVDVRDGSTTQVTHSSGDVVSFAVGRQVVVYYARDPAESPLVLEAGSQNLFSLVAHGKRELRPLSLYKEDLQSRHSEKISAPGGGSIEFNNIWLSPDERSAVFLGREPAPPAHWDRYRTMAPWAKYGPGEISVPVWDRRLRYRWADLNRATSRPLYDAPAGILAFNDTPRHVFWVPGAPTVIVSNTYLPLDTRYPERAHRPAIAEINIDSGRAIPIRFEPLQVIGSRADGNSTEESAITEIAWISSERILRVITRSTGNERQVTEYRRHGKAWRAGTPEIRKETPPLVVYRREGINTPPELIARDAENHEILLYDPHPKLAASSGHTEIFEWQDGNGKNWHGGLSYPRGYLSGHSCPLIVQTHGFSEHEFLIDGPNGGTTAFAAQPLANAGFCVLQAPDAPGVITADSREGASVAAGWRAGVKTLIARGLIERGRVGIIGFSRSGFHVLEALAGDVDLYQAALISDSVQYNYFQLLMTVPDAENLHQIERIMGELPHIPTREWFEAQPLYRVPASVPMRIESADSPLSMWETYAFLRLKKAPVELLNYPNGSHALMKPLERVSSQGGAVDWFRFWLQGMEDPSPAKAGRYTRWRELRDDRAL